MCRSGCRTRNHSSWGECARAANFQVGDLKAEIGGISNAKDIDKRWTTMLDDYKTARMAGYEMNNLSDGTAIVKAMDG